MTSAKQIEANRRNSQKSTGPITLEGKAKVRLNAVKHGLRARTAVISDESQEEFDRLCADLEAEWRPRNRTEHILVEDLALAYWKLARAERLENRILAQEYVTKASMALFVQTSQTQARLRNAFYRALREIEKRQARPAGPDPSEPLEQAEAQAQPETQSAEAPAAAPNHPPAPFEAPTTASPYVCASPQAHSPD